MKTLGRLLRGIWEFIAGDDWVTALGVIAALGLTAILAGTDAAWLVMPLAVAALLSASVWRSARPKRSSEPGLDD